MIREKVVLSRQRGRVRQTAAHGRAAQSLPLVMKVLDQGVRPHAGDLGDCCFGPTT